MWNATPRGVAVFVSVSVYLWVWMCLWVYLWPALNRRFNVAKFHYEEHFRVGGRGEAQAMRSWEGNKLCVWLSCPETFSSLSPLPPLCPQLIGKMCYNIFDGSLDCWLFYGLAYGQPLCCSIFLWPKTCWILISSILMGCGCLPSFLAWPLLKSFREQFSRISGNLIEPAMTVFSENNLNNSHWIRVVNLPAIYICNKQFSTWIYHTYKCQDICMYAP